MGLIANINNQALQLLPDIALWKQQISDSINYKGGNAEPTQAFSTLADEIRGIPNFNTNGIEYVSDKYIPTTLLDAYYNRIYIKSIIDNFVEAISGDHIFSSCSALQSVDMTNLLTISGGYIFSYCSALQSVDMPNLLTISGGHIFSYCSALQSVDMPNLITISGEHIFSACDTLKSVDMPNLISISSAYTFISCPALHSVVFGTLSYCIDPFYNEKNNLRNITIGADTNISLPFKNWTASSVIAEGQSGIDELNDNLYNNLLTKLYDHSTDGQTRTLRIGWLDYVSEDNIAYATDKGWTLTT